MKTIAHGHEVLRLNAQGHNIDNPLEFLTMSSIMVPLMVIILTVASILLEYYLISQPHHSFDRSPTFSDIPLA